jgi:hypothetical protein
VNKIIPARWIALGQYLPVEAPAAFSRIQKQALRALPAEELSLYSQSLLNDYFEVRRKNWFVEFKFD